MNIEHGSSKDIQHCCSMNMQNGSSMNMQYGSSMNMQHGSSMNTWTVQVSRRYGLVSHSKISHRNITTKQSFLSKRECLCNKFLPVAVKVLNVRKFDGGPSNAPLNGVTTAMYCVLGSRLLIMKNVADTLCVVGASLPRR